MKKWDLTQTALAAALKVNSSYVSRILNGERANLSDRVMERLEIVERRGPVAHLLSESENPRPVIFAQGSYRLATKLTPRETLKKLREEKGLSVAEVAKRVDRQIGVIQALEDGGARISEELAGKLAEVYDIDVSVLLGGSDHPQILEEGAGLRGTVGKKPNIALPEGMAARYVPIISMAQAGTMKSFTDEAYQYDAHMAFNVPDRKAIAVEIRGDSMQPVYGEGDIVVLSPSLEPRNGDLVIARLDEEHNGDVMLKLFSTTHGGKRVILTSYNPAYPPLEYERENFAWIYPAANVVKQLRR